MSDRDRSTARIEHDVQTLAGPDYTAVRHRDLPLRVHRRLPQHPRLLHGAVRAARLRGLAGPGRHPRRLQPAARARRRSASARTATPTATAASGTARSASSWRWRSRAWQPSRASTCRCACSRSWRRRDRASGRCCWARRIMLQRVTEEDLKQHIRSTTRDSPSGTPRRRAGYEPERWRESIHELDGLVGWVETHIEQGRVLQDTGNRSGSSRRSPATCTGTCASRAAPTTPARRRWTSASTPPSRARRRSSSSSAWPTRSAAAWWGPRARWRRARASSTSCPAACACRSTCARSPARISTCRSASWRTPGSAATARGVGVEWTERQRLPETPLDRGIVDALVAGAEAAGEPFRVMPSGPPTTRCASPTACPARWSSSLQGRPLAHATRGREPGGRRAGGRDRARGHPPAPGRLEASHTAARGPHGGFTRRADHGTVTPARGWSPCSSGSCVTS